MGTAEGLTSCQLWEVGASGPLMLWVWQAQAWGPYPQHANGMRPASSFQTQ